MEGKGAILCRETKPVKRYCPLIRKEEAVQEETRQIMDRVYGGDVALLAQSLVRPEALNQAEMEELIALLRKGREQS